MGVEIKNNFMEIKGLIAEQSNIFLNEATMEICSQTVQNSATQTGATRRSWRHEVEGNIGVVGSTSINAVYEEFGTGEYALNGDGRKTPWKYQDIKGKWYTTSGKKPKRMLFKAFESKKAFIEKRLKELLKEV